MTNNIQEQDLIGLTEEDAVNKVAGAGMKCRIRSRDGNPFIGTCDYRLDRFNLTIEKNLVTKASLG